MMYVGFTGQIDVNHETYDFLYRHIWSDKNGNIGLPLNNGYKDSAYKVIN